MAPVEQDLPDSAVLLDVQPRATLSSDGRYRFTLLRDCGGTLNTGAVVWLMLSRNYLKTLN